jgi:carbamoyl-phosphate synthase large subunit
MMQKRNVLVFPAGTEIGLEINNALKHCKEVALFGAGQNIPNHARFVFPEYHVLPSIHESGWLPSLIDLVSKLKIDYIFPAYDDVIVALSQAADRIPAAIISSPALACEITRSKTATYRALAGKVRVPHVYGSASEVVSYPVLVKPDRGQGSQGVRVIDTEDELNHAMREVRDPVICEYLPGEEFTVDCFSDRERGLLFAGARSRRRIRNGISVNTVTGQLPEVWQIAEIIGRTLNLRGAWFFQLKRASDGELALLEVAPRIAGAMAAHRVIGVNFPLLSIFEHERLDVKLLINHGEVELDRALSNRYRYHLDFSTAYIDLDDTLILDGQVNLQVVKFIYQCINQRKQIKLITRHQLDLGETLRKHRLQNLFDDVIHITEGTAKSSLITERDAIFIDDSFAERLEVSQRCGIPTFDGSMLEVLAERVDFINGENDDQHA